MQAKPRAEALLTGREGLGDGGHVREERGERVGVDELLRDGDGEGEGDGDGVDELSQTGSAMASSIFDNILYQLL